MPTPVFPAYMTLQTANFREQPQTVVRRSVMESGMTKQARAAAVQRTHYNVTYLVSATDLATFRTWFDTEVAGGAKFFDWVNPVTNNTVQARVLNGELDISPLNLRLEWFLVNFELEVFG